MTAVREDLPPATPGAFANNRDYWHGFDYRPDDDRAWFRTGVPIPVLNGVRRIAQADEGTWSTVAAALDGVPWTWWVGDDSPEGTDEFLVAHGAMLAGRLPMLEVQTGDLAPPHIDGLSIRAVMREEIEDWVAEWAPASGFDPRQNGPVAAAEHARGWPRDADFVRIGAWYDGQIVGSAMLYLAHGVGGIYAVSTREDLRRRGIGRAVTEAAMIAARDRGVGTIALTATTDGHPLYLAMGFTEVRGYRVYSLVP